MGIYKDITPKQRKILRFIQNKISHDGRPPTIREIATWFGFKSTGTVRDYLCALIKKGYLKSTPKKSRSIGLVKNIAFRIPIIDKINSKMPLIDCEEIRDYLNLEDFLSSSEKDTFALRIKGDNMIEKNLLDGDIAIIRRQSLADDGDIIAAWLNEAITVMTFRKKNDTVHLEPANKKYPAISKEFHVLGKVIATIRRHD
ncbi:MAG: transcriptional repressor LexA [Candidatus Omnitrophica bacterium]|nr:transcriptional repressor LexA [Candidatus Omnitrophota bacterium]MDD5352273.1 transcriptional repressor LexA [Candidatus Omnitrophota bacterium]MDD5549872.1 transcriptional repressor LexA [Candidatus Omnitrophota bacterium]